MHKEVKRVELDKRTDMVAILDALCADKAIRVLERDGKPVAALISMEDFERLLLLGPLPQEVRSAIVASGGWKDNDLEADSLIDKIYRWRHESPPGEPVTS